jgi:hypothetical protein
MDENDIIEHINRLAREEHKLFERELQGKANLVDEERMHRLETMLDQCWDLLRQRRARREFGLDADDAQMRDAKTIKGYVG